MYGFGDSKEPNKESVQLLEDLVINYMREVASKAADVSKKESNRIVLNDVLFVIRKDEKKLWRAREANDALKFRKEYEQEITKSFFPNQQ